MGLLAHHESVRCIGCRWLAGSDRTPQWLFAEGRGYCDHPDREGGPWNVLQDVRRVTRCGRHEPADEARVHMREKAMAILEKRLCEKKMREARR